jgi:Concanavalin A-like lectin/glucanases superfamily
LKILITFDCFFNPVNTVLMKRIFATLLVCFQTFLGFAQIQTPYSTLHRVPKGWNLPITNGLVAYYPLLRNTLDESGNEQHAVPFNATLTTDRRGTENAAYQFTGYNSFISCPLKTRDFPSITMSGWVKWDANRQAALIFYIGLASMDGFGLMVSDGACSFGDKICLTFGGSVCSAWTSPNPIPVNQWTHLALVKDGNTWRIFINGTLAGSTTRGYNAPSVHAQIGGSSENGRTTTQGAMSDVLFYNRALSDAEILTLYNR